MKAGQQIRDYVLERLLGKGGMGEVWLGRHVHLDEPRALKVMADELASDQKFRERFLTEARAMVKQNHPHIVSAVDFFEEGGRLVLVMPYIPGGSLADRLGAARGPLPSEMALGVSRDILGALDQAHRKGVIHRDVKPSNILLDQERRAYLTDFGIALMVGDIRKTKTGLSVGTPHYMSPEQIGNPKGLDHRTDVYSFGCVLFEMVTGRPPFVADEGEGDSDYFIKDGHVKQPPPRPSSLNPKVPPALEAVILKALEKDPALRFQGCGEFARALEGEASEKAEPGPPKPPTPRLPTGPQEPPRAQTSREPGVSRLLRLPLRPPPRSGGAWKGALFLVVLAIVVTVLLVWRTSSRSDGEPSTSVLQPETVNAPAVPTSPIPSMLQPETVNAPAVQTSPAPPALSEPTAPGNELSFRTYVEDGNRALQKQDWEKAKSSFQAARNLFDRQEARSGLEEAIRRERAELEERKRREENEALSAGRRREAEQQSSQKASMDPKGPGIQSASGVAVLETTLGRIVIKLLPNKAPNHVKNFKNLCQSGFYNGTSFHRIIPGFMIQGGDPNTKAGPTSTWGKGGNVVNGREVTLKAEFNDTHHARGIVSMARSHDPNSASSQFFICVADAGYLDGQYTVFGEVTEGMQVVDKIVAGQRKGDQAVNPVAIVSARAE